MLTPDDSFNRELVSQTHPADWTNPTPAGKYDLVAIGGGTAGIISALFPAGLDGKSALIERHLLGGDCLNFGCVPSKALIRAARAAHALTQGEQFGLPAAEAGAIAFDTVMQRMRKLRAQISHHDSAERFTSLGVDVYLGTAKFVSENSVEVDGQLLEFKRCVIATGARALVPPIAGIESAPYLTNETLFSLTELPKRFLVVGGGPIGAEMAQAFHRFGSEVHLIDRAPRILNKEDPAAAQVVQDQFEQEGVNLHLNTGVEKIEKAGDGVRLTLKESTTENITTLEGDAVLIAVGRTPNVDGLNLEKAGVTANKRGVDVNDRLQTANPRIYAAGDIAGSHQFTHAADAMARMCIRNAFFFGSQKVSDLVVPRTTYTEPELAHVGMTPAEANEAGIEIDSFRSEFAENDRAILDGDTAGFAVAHCKKGTDKIVGATIVSKHAGDLIGELSLMMTKKLPLGTLGSVIHCYPTQAEILKKLGDSYKKTMLTPFRKKVLQWLMSWRS